MFMESAHLFAVHVDCSFLTNFINFYRKIVAHYNLLYLCYTYMCLKINRIQTIEMFLVFIKMEKIYCNNDDSEAI